MCSNKAYLRIHNLFTPAARERCMTNFKKQPVLNFGKFPSQTAAVLVPMCSVNDVPALLYTVRSPDLRTNSGQISFPGGKTDKGETPIQTALRETQEEIGLCPSKVDIWCQGPAVPGRNNKILITPVIGCIQDLKNEDLCINNREVAEVFAVSIGKLCDPQNQYYTQYKNGFILPVFVVGSYKIWGITAYITHTFLRSLLTKDLYRNEWMKKKVVIQISL